MKPKQKTIISIALITCLTIALAVAAEDQRKGREGPSDPSARDLYKKGLERRLLGKGSGMEYFKKSAEAAPDFVPAHREYVKSHGAVMVRAEYEEKVKKNPNAPALRLALGTVYFYTGQVEEAESEFRKAAELDPDSPWVHLSLALLLHQKGTDQQALAEYKRASELGKTSVELHAALADSYVRIGELDLAVQACQRALALDPEYFWVYPIKWMAQMSRAAGDGPIRQAIKKELERLTRSHGARVDVLAVAEQGYQIIGERAHAEKLREQIREKTGDPKKSQAPAHPDAAVVYYQIDGAGEMVAVRGVLAKRIREANSSKTPPGQAVESLKNVEVEILKEPSVYVSGKGAPTESAPVASEAQREHAKKVLVYPALAEAYARAGDFENAERLLSYAPLWHPHTRTEVTEALARAYADRKVKLDQALAMARGLVEQVQAFKPWPAPASIPADLWQQMYPEETQRAYYKGRRSHAYDVLGWAQAQTGALDEAERSLALSLEAKRTEHNLFHMGLIKKRQGQIEPALALLLEAYAFEGHTKEDVRREAQELYAALGKPRQAFEDQLAKAVQKAKDAPAKSLPPAEPTESRAKPLAADFVLRNFKGDQVRLSALRGKVVFLGFWATW